MKIKHMEIDGVKIAVDAEADISEEEATKYLRYVQAKVSTYIERLEIIPKGNDVELTWQTRKVGFERIRRITGYLVGTIDRWNNAKRAEEQDRVKHA